MRGKKAVGAWTNLNTVILLDTINVHVCMIILWVVHVFELDLFILNSMTLTLFSGQP